MPKGKSWSEPDHNDVDMRRLYQVMQNNEDSVETNIYEKLQLGSPMYII